MRAAICTPRKGFEMLPSTLSAVVEIIKSSLFDQDSLRDHTENVAFPSEVFLKEHLKLYPTTWETLPASNTS